MIRHVLVIFTLNIESAGKRAANYEHALEKHGFFFDRKHISMM
jgi:hypothetical protein